MAIVIPYQIFILQPHNVNLYETHICGDILWDEVHVSTLELFIEYHVRSLIKYVNGLKQIGLEGIWKRQRLLNRVVKTIS